MSKRLERFEEVFALREQAIQSEGLRAVYRDVVDSLIQDVEARPSLGTIELLMTERTAFLYVWIRDREERGIGQEGVNPVDPTQPPGFVHERNYRETLKDWFDMASKLQMAFSRADPEIEPPDSEQIRLKAEYDVGAVVRSVAEEMLPMAEAKALTSEINERYTREHGG